MQRVWNIIPLKSQVFYSNWVPCGPKYWIWVLIVRNPDGIVSADFYWVTLVLWALEAITSISGCWRHGTTHKSGIRSFGPHRRRPPPAGLLIFVISAVRQGVRIIPSFHKSEMGGSSRHFWLVWPKWIWKTMRENVLRPIIPALRKRWRRGKTLIRVW